ncbi:hypothetical protein [Aquabacterium sp. NJ1]|uniref:hypothetical protein n=1 Tax=Aquabacterium sp. NJ1 TaxID=1538295 RepID=UPI001269F191|nr:hypothetical protein [Aquabacterium sp. NJ1]
MKRLSSSLIMVCLMGASFPAPAVQDPQASAAQLDSRLAEVRAEIAKVNTQLVSTRLRPSEKKMLRDKQRSLVSEQHALTEAKSRNARLQENQLVRYAGDGAKNSEGDRVDRLFEK